MPSNATDATDRTLVRLVVLVLAVFLLVPLLTMAFAAPVIGGMGWWGMHDAGMAGVAPWWGFGMTLVWLLILVGLGYVGYRALVGGRGGAVDPAIEELRLAYARGDLTEEEFEARREVLADEREP